MTGKGTDTVYATGWVSYTTPTSKDQQGRVIRSSAGVDPSYNLTRVERVRVQARTIERVRNQESGVERMVRGLAGETLVETLIQTVERRGRS